MDEATRSFGTLAQSLEEEYIPLDPALVRALLSDYDHRDEEQLRTLREHLDALRASAVADDAALFDPSGASNVDGFEDTRSSPEKSASGVSEGWERETQDTELSYLSQNLSSVGLGRGSGSEAEADNYIGDIESLDREGKMIYLGELFPTQKIETIEYLLKKCDGSFARAMDVLLNSVYFEESEGLGGDEKVRAKGIDAFDEEVSPRGRRKKGKKKGKMLSEYERSASEHAGGTASNAHNHWKLAEKDIEFVSSRTGFSTTAVQSLYNKNGASVKATITAILEQEAEEHGDTVADDQVMAVNIATLASEFPSLPLASVIALVRITDPSTAKAHELAKALVSSGSRTPDLPLGRIVPQYAPVRLDDDPTSAATARSSSSPSSRSSSAAPMSPAQLANLRTKLVLTAYSAGQQPTMASSAEIINLNSARLLLLKPTCSSTVNLLVMCWTCMV